MKLKKFLIDNGTSTLEENKEIKILKINFPSTHIPSTYKTQAYKRKLKYSDKFERIRNTDETYPRPISNQTSLVPDKSWNSTLTPIDGREKSRDQMQQLESENYNLRHNLIKTK